MTDQQKTDHISDARQMVVDQLSVNPGELNHADLGRLAERCTTGDPWYKEGDLCGRQTFGQFLTQDRAFIAAASPATVLALLSEIATLRSERDAYRLVAINQGWNWKSCALHVDEDAYRKHREDHVDACAKSALQSIARETGK